MTQIMKRQIAYALYPRFSKTVDALNWNGAFQQWLKNNPPHVCFKTRIEMFQHLNDDVISNQPVTYLEFGVFKGESILQWASLNTHHDSRFFGFDSFEGLPEDWYNGIKKGQFKTGGTIPKTDDDRVSFVKGRFQETLRDFVASFETDNRLIVHIDCVLYTSTLFCLTILDRFFRPGTIVVSDEMCAAEHEFRAFIDYTTSYQRSYQSLVGAGSPYIQRVAVVME
jgi:hypothetical protein